jgi:O-antigen ligase
MLNKSVEQAISLFLYIGVTFATVFLMTDSVTDPVNVTKLAAAGGVGFAVFAIAIIQGRQGLKASSLPLALILGLFILAMANSIFASKSPFSQNIYGVYGRQTAFIFYLVMSMVAVGASLLRDIKSFERIARALFIAGGLNLLYCAWALAFGDFLGWSNPYGNILGLFGNPDFISAFLGMFIAGVVGYIAAPNKTWPVRIAGTAASLIAFYEIHRSHAIQGKAVTAAGLAIVGFYWARSRFKGSIPTISYLAVVAIGGGFALAGALQKGPLTQYIYKTSVSLRGQYWQAAINAGTSHPFSGVGLDSFGDWYRRTRTEYAATTLPGPGVITNAAHNVVLDFFASGGWPLLLTYLGTIGLGIWVILKVTLRSRAYNGIFVSLAATWVCYELQSVISINQAGLAIWGWVLLGALIAYEYSTRDFNTGTETVSSKLNKKSVKSASVFSPQLIGGIGAVIGVLVAVPPMSADMKWKSALKSQQLSNVEAALHGGYLQPISSARLAQAVQMFEQSKLPDQAYIYAKKGVEFNPDYTDAWKMLYYATKSTEADKALALKNMKRLDPFNPDVLKN